MADDNKTQRKPIWAVLLKAYETPSWKVLPCGNPPRRPFDLSRGCEA